MKGAGKQGTAQSWREEEVENPRSDTSILVHNAVPHPFFADRQKFVSSQIIWPTILKEAQFASRTRADLDRGSSFEAPARAPLETRLESKRNEKQAWCD